MSERFIKYIPSEKSQWLRRNYPNAFLLLSVIAERARRVSGNPDGLNIGDAILGDYSEAGLSRQNYRTALKKLVELNIVKIISNGRLLTTCQKSTIKLTIKGTIVNITNSDIWDMNLENTNHVINQDLTKTQPRPNHKEERIRKNKNEEEIKEKIKKEKFGKFVELEKSEHEALCKEFSAPVIEEFIGRVNYYCTENRKKGYHDYAQTIRNWINKERKPLFPMNNPRTDRRTKEIDGTPVSSPVDGRF